MRASLTVSVSLMLLPLVSSALIGYFLLKHTVIADYQDVAERQRGQMVPVQNLQLAMLQTEVPLEEYLISGSPERLRDYRSLRQDIETDFASLADKLKAETTLYAQIERAREDWDSIDGVVMEILAANEARDKTRLNEFLARFDTVQASAHDKLAAVYNLIQDSLDREYRDASLGFERSEWVAGIAAGLSLLLMMGGIYFFGRTILDSVNRLVEGAERFAGGDHDHTIEVKVPPELHKVANEFNRMIRIIHKTEEALLEQASRDTLTGLLNRRSFDEATAEVFARLQRLKEETALIALDIDYFKRVNDSYGHTAGDDVLYAVAKTMQESVRSIDKVFRTGGEEFFILLPGANAAAAMSTAERLRQAVENLVVSTSGKDLKVTASLGFALAGASGADTPDALIKLADDALYKAKASGRNRVVAADGAGV